MVRLQKFLAEAGVASRRASEELILAGDVAVNGQIVKVLGTKVDPARDRVTVDGTPVKIKRKLYVALNKPRGCLCSRRDPAKLRQPGAVQPLELVEHHQYDARTALILYAAARTAAS